MATIFEDPAVVEAATRVMEGAAFDRYDAETRVCALDDMRASLGAAVAALDREALIEKAVRAVQAGAAQGLIPGRLSDPICRALAHDALVAIGLIPADSTDDE